MADTARGGIDGSAAQALVDAARSRAPVSLGARRTASPHEYYRYPARFSPGLARAIIEGFSRPGDLVIDPFVGGGTSAVEALLTGRSAVVADINPLATFVTRVKSTPLSESQRAEAASWVDAVAGRVNLRRPAPDTRQWDEAGYFRHLDTPSTWRLSKAIALALDGVDDLDPAVSAFCRCVVLRTAQWALDMRSSLPTVHEFREALGRNGVGMVDAARSFSEALSPDSEQAVVVDAGVPGLASRLRRDGLTRSPALILTSPPYPGVYVNYHRWKMRGRKEIKAAYWISSSRDGHGLAYYTMSARSDATLDTYFAKLQSGFSDVRRVAGPETTLVQVVGFNDPGAQLPRYLAAMEASGFREELPPGLATEEDGRLWREVPGRRWWTEARANRGVAPHTSREVVLVHRPAP